jgi:hypothetical protein
MNPRIGLVHATLAAVPPMVTAFRQHAPVAALLHFLDEGLLPLVNRDGLTPVAVGEVQRLVARAVMSGVDGVLLTCSAFSPAVPAMQSHHAVPIMSIDDAMLRIALQYGPRIGVVATVAAAGPITAKLLKDYAAEAQRDVEVQVRVVAAAFSALQCDDVARHDSLVREQIASLQSNCDAVVLAQVSMARALTGAPVFAKPVLTSPEASIRALLARLSPPKA